MSSANVSVIVCSKIFTAAICMVTGKCKTFYSVFENVNLHPGTSGVKRQTRNKKQETANEQPALLLPGFFALLHFIKIFFKPLQFTGSKGYSFLFPGNGFIFLPGPV